MSFGIAPYAYLINIVQNLSGPFTITVTGASNVWLMNLYVSLVLYGGSGGSGGSLGEFYIEDNLSNRYFYTYVNQDNPSSADTQQFTIVNLSNLKTKQNGIIMHYDNLNIPAPSGVIQIWGSFMQ